MVNVALYLTENNSIKMWRSENFKWKGKFIGGECLIGGGGIHISVFTDHKNNRFQDELLVQNADI